MREVVPAHAQPTTMPRAIPLRYEWCRNFRAYACIGDVHFKKRQQRGAGKGIAQRQRWCASRAPALMMQPSAVNSAWRDAVQNHAFVVALYAISWKPAAARAVRQPVAPASVEP